MAILQKPIKLPIDSHLFVSLISGSEAGIATTTAIVAGLVGATDDRQVVLFSAYVALVVQAFNSAMIAITSTHTAHEIENNQAKESFVPAISLAGMQFLTHVAASTLTLLPIIFITDLQLALLISIIVSLSLLFLIGLMVGLAVKHTPIRNGVSTMVLGALVISVGLLAGLILN